MVVSNAGPLIWLSRIGKFEILRELFTQVWIAPEVYAEVVERAAGYPSATNVIRACTEGWMKVVNVVDTQRTDLLCAELHAGEAQSIILALERNVKILLVDDLKARNFAVAAGLHVIGTAGILLQAYFEGKTIDVPTLLDQMRQDGFRLSEKVYQDILSRIAAQNNLCG